MKLGEEQLDQGKRNARVDIAFFAQLLSSFMSGIL